MKDLRKPLSLLLSLLMVLFTVSAGFAVFASAADGDEPDHEHQWVEDPENSVPSNCGTDAVIAKKCTICGIVETIRQDGTATGNHSWEKTGELPGSCITPAKTTYECSVCHQTKSEDGALDPTNHVGETIVTGAQDADCNGSGYSGDTVCAACGATISAGAVIPKTTHEWELTSSTSENICVRAGTNTYTCKHCGETRTMFEPAKGHMFSEWEVTVAATCTEKGAETRTCSACGDVETRDIAALGHKDEDGDGKCDRCEADYEDPNPTYVFRCTHCDIYEANKNRPVIGAFYAFIHFFIHYAQFISTLPHVL